MILTPIDVRISMNQSSSKKNKCRDQSSLKKSQLRKVALGLEQ
jgi:hypothetical protein